MKTLCLVGLSIVMNFAILPAHANEETAVLSSCLVDNLNGRERKGLSKWIFMSLSVHPEIRNLTTIGPETFEESDQYIGSLISRLLTENCPGELVAATRADPLALQKSFELVGQVAVQELMTNDEVTARLASYAKYVDMDKLSKILPGN